VKDHAYRVLQWIAYSRRPLRVSELQCGLSLRPGQTSIDEDSHFKKSIVSICGPILEERQGDIVDMVHFSAKESVSSAGLDIAWL
jgi:hypothetical protein